MYAVNYVDSPHRMAIADYIIIDTHIGARSDRHGKDLSLSYIAK